MPAAYLSVCVLCLVGCAVSSGAVLNTQNLCDWGRAEHFKDFVTIVVFTTPYPVTIVVLPTLIHRRTVLLCFILSGWVLLDLVAFCQIRL